MAAIPATSVTYEHNNSELLLGGLVIKGNFPDGGITVTVPIDSLFDDDLAIVVTQNSINAGCKLQEILASRVVGVPGQLTLARTDGSENTSDQKFAILIIRKGLGRHLSPGSPVVKLLYNHPNGMNVFMVTTVAGATQTVNLPGIFLQSDDKVVVFDTTAVSQSAFIEIKASRLDYPTESISIGTAGGEALVNGDNLIIVVFKSQSYDKFNSASSISGISFKPIQGPFGPMDFSGKTTILSGQDGVVISGVPYLTSDTIIVPIQTAANSNLVNGVCEDYSERTAGVAPATTNFEIAPCDSTKTAGADTTCDFLIIQTQGRKF